MTTRRRAAIRAADVVGSSGLIEADEGSSATSGAQSVSDGWEA
jgi:hypothetical protein